MIIWRNPARQTCRNSLTLKKNMEDKRLKIGGFAELEEREFCIRGGLNPDTIRKIAKILGILVDFITSYGEDFYKGYKKALEGKPLYSFAS